MKLVMTLLVRDEVDIIAANLDFHLSRGVDFFIACDNLSKDGTADVLRRYEARGLLHYLRESGDDFAQHRWVTRMARLACSDFGADWVINNDADEFWYPHRGTLKDVLRAVRATAKAVIAPRENFVARPMRPDDFFAEVLTVRERVAHNFIGQPLPPKVCHRGFPDIEVEQGNHSVMLAGEPLSGVRAPISVFHFPIRGRAQFTEKVRNAGSGYAKTPTLDASVGHVKRHLYDLYLRGELDVYYDSVLVDDARLRAGLADRSLVSDHRMQTAFRTLESGPSRWSKFTSWMGIARR
ncbi:MAG: glycosyltransferase family 2 protein [Devosia sp.]|nr:glycosyltransferase family 2 protein [Devosia sp.]